MTTIENIFNKFNVSEYFSFNFIFPSSVKIHEVGPRDGLQNEKNILNIQNRINLIEKLVIFYFFDLFLT